MINELPGEDSPGATPLDDVSGLIPRYIQTRAELHEVEARNIARAVTKYLMSRPSKRKAPFTREWSYRLHHEMFGHVWQWAGQRRQRELLNIGVAPHLIEERLENLMLDLVAWREFAIYPILEQAARLHHRAVQIHPFKNGNGRWSRMLANVLLKQEGLQPTLWPETEIVGAESAIRGRYLDAVRAADNENIDPLLALHREFTPPAV